MSRRLICPGPQGPCCLLSPHFCSGAQSPSASGQGVYPAASLYHPSLHGPQMQLTLEQVQNPISAMPDSHPDPQPGSPSNRAAPLPPSPWTSPLCSGPVCPGGHNLLPPLPLDHLFLPAARRMLPLTSGSCPHLQPRGYPLDLGSIGSHNTAPAAEGVSQLDQGEKGRAGLPWWSPGFKTPRFHCKELGFDPWWGTKIFRCCVMHPRRGRGEPQCWATTV